MFTMGFLLSCLSGGILQFGVLAAAGQLGLNAVAIKRGLTAVKIGKKVLEHVPQNTGINKMVAGVQEKLPQIEEAWTVVNKK